MSPKGFEVTVEPAVLLWARNSAGYDAEEVAEALQLRKDEVSRWELGKEKPTLSKLEKLANKYKRPLAAFFLPTPPEEKPLPKDFRTISSKQNIPIIPETRLAIRRASRLQSLAKELLEDLNREPISQLGIDKRNNPENLATNIRKTLGTDMQQQFAWRHEGEALMTWQKNLEKLGVFVFQLSMQEEIRGFSLTIDVPPAIVLNRRDAFNGKIFSLFHEYAHILCNEGGICDMQEERWKSKDALTEQFCNHLAGAILVPKADLLDHKLVRVSGGRDKWQDEILQVIARDFKVSCEVILRRLVLLGLASLEFYKSKHNKWKLDYEVKRELAKKNRKKEGFARHIPHECIRENSIPFVSLVLDAYAQKTITYNDVADYLGVRLKHLPKIETLLRK